jgi:hypothetical protein
MFNLQRSVIFVLIAVLFFTARAQNPAPQSNQDVVRINTQLVQVDAVVTDKRGKHVKDLTESDVEQWMDFSVR